jgi:hypothetical protein
METEALPPVTDLQSAVPHLEGLLDMSGSQSSDPQEDNAPETEQLESAEPDQGEADTTPEEEPASGDDQEVTEPDENPAIIPPNSWNAEEKEQFKLLPPEIQQTLARRESERDSAVSQRMQQLAEQRKSIEGQVAQATQAQTQYAQTLNQLLSLTVPELQEIENTDWVRLASEDQHEYIRRTAVRDGLRQRVGYMQQQMQQVQQQQQQQMLAQHQEHLVQQYQVLTEQVPEFRDANKAQALVQDIGQTMQGYGFTTEEIGSVADARIVRVMARLAVLERQEAVKRSALAKRTSAPAPRMMTPNAPPTRQDNQNKKMSEQFNTLKRSGSVRDAAAILEHIL